MKPFPEKYELIGFFESEPVLADLKDPWEYNHLTFLTARGRDRVECEIEPAEMVLHLTWIKNGSEIVNVNIESATGIQVENREGRESMRVTFSSDRGVLVLQLKPVVHVFMELKMI